MSAPVPVVIALGANLGDRLATLSAAVLEIARAGVELTRLSDPVETDPVGGPRQPDYLNAVLLGRTALGPHELLDALLTVERAHGRVREVRWDARTLDLDVIQVGTPGQSDEVRLDETELQLPHPRAHERAFVLVPWAQADPGALLRLPGGGIVRVRDIAGRLDGSGVRVAEGWPDGVRAPALAPAPANAASSERRTR